MWSSTFISYTALLFLLIPHASAQRRAGGRYIAGGGSPGAAPYALVDDYNASNFFDKFAFFSPADPTNGHVQYRNRSIAQRDGLAFISDRNTIILKPYTTNRYPGPAGSPGRPSVRLESLNAYSHGLFIFDAYHMPKGCGTWPAYWMAGPRFPTTGEIDMIEGTSLATVNTVSMYSPPDSNCSVSANGQSGFFVQGTSLPNNYGAGFNSIQGGVYATEWTSSFIKIWWFPRDRIPASITAGSPDPAQFGTPAVNARGSCDFTENLVNQTVIFNIDFCGSYAGTVYTSSHPTCPQSNSTAGNARCVDWVGDNPANFTEAYWKINRFQVYQMPAGAGAIATPSSVPATQPTTPALPRPKCTDLLIKGPAMFCHGPA